MHGFISFLGAIDFSSAIYNVLSFQIAFSSGESVSATWTIGNDVTLDVLVTSFVPSQAAYLAALDNYNNSGTSGFSTTSKSATHMVNTFTVAGSSPAVTVTQTFNLSSATDINYWRHLAVDRLISLKAATVDAGYGNRGKEYDWGHTLISFPGLPAITYWADGVTFSLSDVPDPPLLGSTIPVDFHYNSPTIDTNNASGAANWGRILQASVGITEIFGIEGAHYYPGLNLADRRTLAYRSVNGADVLFGSPDTNPMTNLIPDIETDWIWMTAETLHCSHALHRIHHPVVVRGDFRTILTGHSGIPGYNTSLQPSEEFGPDNYPFPASPDTLSPVDMFGRSQFSTLCPATVYAGFFPDWSDRYVVEQIYSTGTSASNVAPFTIPP